MAQSGIAENESCELEKKEIERVETSARSLRGIEVTRLRFDGALLFVNGWIEVKRENVEFLWVYRRVKK